MAGEFKPEQLYVKLIAHTCLLPEVAETLRESGYSGSTVEQLVEFSARVCTQTVEKTDEEKGATLLRMLLEWGHLSVIEHASATFLVRGVSRALTHELVRHRHFSFSQLSQRFFDHSEASFVIPPAVADDRELALEYVKAYRAAASAYDLLLQKLHRKGLKGKALRSACRYLLPNGTSTTVVVTANMRALRHFIRLRGSKDADLEIRHLAVEMLRQLRDRVSTRLFSDFEIYQEADGFPAIRTHLPD